jgi:quercetin dioxygenase-like cupin family protein
MKKLIAAAVSVVSIASTPAIADSIEIRHSSEVQIVTGKPENFTGNAGVRAMLPPNEFTHASVGLVDFAPGARTTWHSHPAGQMLIVTSGTGWIQEEGKPRRVIEAGDVVWIPVGVKHWHGATDRTAMSHIALTYMKGDKNVDWLEPVSEEQYR